MIRSSFLLVLCLTLLVSSTSAGADQWTSRTLVVVATAYDPGSCCCGKHADGRTATNRSAWLAGVAVDPSVIPLGSRLDIPGYNRGPNGNGSWIKADDTGSGIKGKEIDVRFSSHSEAKEWGRRTIRVRIWEKKHIR